MARPSAFRSIFGAANGARFHQPSNAVKGARFSHSLGRNHPPARGKGALEGARFHHPSPAAAASGKLFVCGWSKSGALGLGDDVTKATVPTEVPTEGAVVSVACGKKFTVFATDDGKVYAMGDNSNGELGSTSAPKKQAVPVQV